MELPKKLQHLVDQKIITRKQAEKIVAVETEKRSGIVWKTLYWLAGLFVGLGIILIIGANWRDIPDGLKLVGNFALFGGCLYGIYWSITAQKKYVKELFLTLSFLMVGGTIGLIGQIFHLSGGWDSFATAWAVLSLPFILMSSMISLNIIWLLILNVGVRWDRIVSIVLRSVDEPVTVLVIATILLGLLSYAGTKLHKALGEKIMLPEAFAFLSGFAMYAIALIGGAILGYEKYFMAHVFVFIFLGVRMVMAFYKKDNLSFRNNTVLAECYIFYLFFSQFGTLFISGVGFIIGGALLLLMIYLLKKTSSHIKKLEFK